MKKDIRILIAEDISNRWNLAEIDYAVVHGIEEYPQKIGRDLDVLIRKDHIDKALSISGEVFKTYNWHLVINLPPIYGKRVIAFNDDYQNFIEIHTISDLTWFMATFAHKPESKYQKGPFKVDPWANVVKRFLMVILGAKDLGKERFSKRPAELVFSEYEKAMCSRFEKYFGSKNGNDLKRCITDGDLDPILLKRRSLQIRIIVYSIGRPFLAMHNLFKFLTNRILQFTSPCAPIIAVVGPDGVGKTTVIDLVISELPTVFNSILHKHWRPFFLPPLGKFVGLKSGRPGPPRREAGKFYYFRLLYYYVDFWVGHYIKDATVVAKQRIIIYDRCWLDAWVDPFRYGFSSTLGIKYLWRFLPKPNKVVLLTDDAERIYSRKPELAKTEIQDQLAKWLQLFQEGYVNDVIRVDDQPIEIAHRLKNLVMESFIEMNGGPVEERNTIQ